MNKKIDPRITKQAEIIVNHSIKVKKGDRVVIVADFDAKPLVLELYRLLIKKGADWVNHNFVSEEFDTIYYENSTSKQRKMFPKVKMFEIQNCDCWIRIYAPSEIKALGKIDPQKISESVITQKPIRDWRHEKTRWVVTAFPNKALAKEAKMTPLDFEKFVYSSIINVDWQKKEKEQQALVKHLNTIKKVRIVNDGTNITFGVNGRKAVSCAGEYNMPDGEVFTSIEERSANGYISFSYPAIYLGREFKNVRLEFKDGKVIKATSDKYEEDLNKILDTDDGSRFLGEFGIGNNYKITKFTKDILFDEKIGGTIHLSLGSGYKETLSKNESAIHWDMVCDLRDGGEIWFDNKLVQKNGQWLI